MKLKALTILGCGVVLAALVSGCGEKDKLVNNYNCMKHVHVLNAEYPGFLDKCNVDHLGKFSDVYKHYNSRVWSQRDNDANASAEYAKDAEIIASWRTEPGVLSQEEAQRLAAKHPSEAMKDLL